MNKDQLAIVTITWARDEQEEHLLRTALQELARVNIPVYITDGGSNDGFLDFIAGFPQFVLVEKKEEGLWGQVKSSFTEANRSNAAFFLYTEPDKKDFFKDGLNQLLDAVSVDSRSGIIAAARTPEGFASFPAFQQMTETTINNCCAEITGHAMDFTYGPFLINKDLVAPLIKIEEKVGWGWRPCAFTIASRLGYKLEAHPGNYFCPTYQRQDNPVERIYRMRQLQEHLEGLIFSTRMPVD